jgi:hypothetical protein
MKSPQHSKCGVCTLHNTPPQTPHSRKKLNDRIRGKIIQENKMKSETRESIKIETG